MFALVKSFVSQYALYFKIGVVVILCALAASGTYLVMDARIVRLKAQAEEDKRKAVGTAMADVRARLNLEVRIREKIEELVDARLDELMKSISNIRVENKTITNNITKEREVHKEFYMQPLPPGGYEQWKRARAMVAPASSPAP